MRHFLPARPPRLLSRGVLASPARRPLISISGPTEALSPPDRSARAQAVEVAVITPGADPNLLVA